MTKVKMKFGIDLGTTNSAICRMVNGEPTIIRTSTQEFTLPSCVSFRRTGIVVGDQAYNDLRQNKVMTTRTWTKDDDNVFLEFKRTMGMDVEHRSSNMPQDHDHYSSEELSAEVLKALKESVRRDCDEEVNACVITVPATFKANQMAATKRAAELAGIKHCELLQEPIAASIAYGISKDKNGTKWLVFDLGGGTFDAALLNAEGGVMCVKDTEGDNRLGGKDIDYAIVDSIIIPYLEEHYSINGILGNDEKKQILRDAMKCYAEKAKIMLSENPNYCIDSYNERLGRDDNEKELSLYLAVTKEQIEKIEFPTFQKAIDICNRLLSRNNLTGKDIDSLILVGGPTCSPVLREMLKNQITQNVNTKIDPMTAIARGAALYASTIDTEVVIPDIRGSVVLSLTYDSCSVSTKSPVGVRFSSIDGVNPIPQNLYIKIKRSDGGWSSDKVRIGRNAVVIDCLLMEDRANSFSIVAYDNMGNTIPCCPGEINIIQGLDIAKAVLPYNIGVDYYNHQDKRSYFRLLKGLEKNQVLPATGVATGLCNPEKIRKGKANDLLRIPIYQGEYNAVGTSSIYNDHVFDVIITGEDVPKDIPEYSLLNVTLNVDRSQNMTMGVQWTELDVTIEKEVERVSVQTFSEKELSEWIIEANSRLFNLMKRTDISEFEYEDIKKLLDDIENRFDNEKLTEDGRMHLLTDLRQVYIGVENIEMAH